MKILRCWMLGVAIALLLVGCASRGTTDNHHAGQNSKQHAAHSKHARKHHTRFEFVPSIKPKEVWHRTVGHGSGPYFLHLTPAINRQGTMFVASYKGEIEAINSQNGHRLWRRRYYYNFISGIAVSNDLLFVGTSDGHMLAIRQSDGCVVWSVVTSSQMLASPQTSANLVLAHTTDGVLSAYVIKNGELSWQQREAQPAIMLYLGSQPLVVGDKVLCGFANGRLVAFNLSDGQRLWARQVAEPQGMTDVSRMVDITSRPVVMNNTVYIVNYQGNLMALNLADGKVFWQHKLSAFANIASAAGRLYLTDVGGNVWAFDARSGAVIWRQVHLAMSHLSAPAVIGSAVVVGDASGYVTWMSVHDGHFLASDQLSPSSVLTQPLVWQGKLFIYAASGKLMAYRPS